MSVRWWQALVALVLWSSAPVEAVVTGSIFGPGTAKVPIAVVLLDDLGGVRDAGARFTDVLRHDLEISGYFQLLDPASFPERPPSLDLTVAGTDFTGWEATGAQAVVKGAIHKQGGGVSMQVRMFDVVSQKEVTTVSRAFDGRTADVPRMAHRFADRILEYLTGIAGPFDSSIVFTSTRGGGLKDLYRYTFPGTVERLTEEQTLTLTPRWHPDGRRVLFTSYREHVPRLFEIDVGSRRIRRALKGSAVILNGAWSPDGSMLLVSREMGGNSDIFLLDRSGKVLRRLTDHWAIDVSPTWAPDGRRFAFCSARAGAPHIYTMNVDGSAMKRVSNRGSYNTSPAWSPTGDHLAYTMRDGGFHVVVVGTDGTGARTITRSGDNEDPSWSPDGRYLVYSSRQGGRRSLMLGDRGGRFQRELTTGRGDDTSPTWSPRHK